MKLQKLICLNAFEKLSVYLYIQHYSYRDTGTLEECLEELRVVQGLLINRNSAALAVCMS